RGGGVKVEHGGGAHGDGAGGQHHHAAVGQLFGLLGGHDDGLVVGQDKDGLGRHALDGGQDVLGGGAHGRTTRDDGLNRQLGKDALKALAGGHRHKAVVPAGIDGSVNDRGGDGAGGALLLLGLGLLFQALALFLAGQELLVHVFDLEVGKVAVL